MSRAAERFCISARRASYAGEKRYQEAAVDSPLAEFGFGGGLGHGAAANKISLQNRLTAAGVVWQGTR